jgi:solute carrier family 25 phosphate transporter 23/24/25/41
MSLQFLRMVPGLDDPNYAGVVNLLGGGLAGVTAASVTYPLDVVRTRLATQVMFFLLL